MTFIEAPTNFYLGRTFDSGTGHLGDDVVYYDSRDLTTHAIVVGMTGSGKTGLCVSMLEEAILDNIPAIIIDPKGDITNIALTFPELRPQDFQPWIHQDDARRAGMDIATYSADIAQTWRDGLAQWGIVPDRLRWLSKAAQMSIYTPGSDAGLPISILASLRAPRFNWQGQEELVRERINGLVTALFTLAGMNFEPIKDVEHVLLSNIIETNWKQGRDLTLEDIVLQIQAPPFDKLGVFSIDQAISEKRRYSLAMEMNNIIAAPSFQSWLQGQPLDMQQLLYQPNGQPKVSIFYTAHLNDQERMFITTLILETMIGWMRTLSGTPSLRALLYIDEMFGYFPPYPKNPPTKEPLLRLIKQARAFGIGLILATQNPGDIDYKGLSNAGTWFIGRLSSENDRKKVMAGLQSMTSAEEGIDLSDVERIIADIQPRVFLMRNVHNQGGSILIHTRWAMNYLAGPLTRQQIAYLMQGQKQQLAAQLSQQHYAAQNPSPQPLQSSWTQPHQTGYGAQPPPPGIPGYNQPQQGGYGTPPPPPGIPGYNQPQQGGYGAPPPPEVGIYGQGGGGYPTQQQQGAYGTPPAGSFGAQSAGDTGAFSAQGVNSGSTGSMRIDRLAGGFSQTKPPVSSSTPEYFLPAVLTSQQALTHHEEQTGQRVNATSQILIAYKPVLLAQTSVRYSEKKAQIYTARDYAFHVPNLDARSLVHWDEFQAPVIDTRQISQQPHGQALFSELPLGLQDDKRLKSLEKELIDFLYNMARLIVPFNQTFNLFGNPDTDVGQFQAMVYQRAREERDAEVDKVSRKYGEMMDKLEDKLRRKERELGAEQFEIKDRKQEHLATTGEALLSLWKGKTSFTVSRMSRASRLKKQSELDLQESREVIAEIEREMYNLEQEYEQVLTELNNRWGRVANDVQEFTVAPFKKDIHINLFGVGWVPHYYINTGAQPVVISAFA